MTFEEYEEWSGALDKVLGTGWECLMVQQAVGICGDPAWVRSRLEQLMLDEDMGVEDALVKVVNELAFNIVST